MILQLLAAFIGTVAFALLFSVPKKDYIPAGIVGMLGWGLCYFLSEVGMPMVAASFLATLIVVLLARYFAVVFRSPSTTFLIPGIFPLVPGGKIFWAVYYFMLGNSSDALKSGADAFRCAFAIVLGIMTVLHLPGLFFKNVAFWRRPRKHK